MGGILRALTGGSKQKSTSGNYAYEGLNSSLSPSVGFVGQAGDSLAALLGLTGDSTAQQGALDNFAHSGGMDWLMDRGNRGVVANNAAKGLLKSGSTLKGMQAFSQGLSSTYLGKYMDNLFNLSKLGLGSAGILSDAGKYGTQSGSSSGGILGAVKDIISIIP